jgi:hypothetical protein
MKQISNYPKVARDMFFAQLNWTFGFFGVMLVIHIIKIVLAYIQGGDIDSFYNAMFVVTNIYMLVIGIISIYFLPYYVEHGVTRKDYFKGTLIAFGGLAITIPFITYMISFVERVILNAMTSISIREPDLNSVILEVDSDIVGDIVQAIILTPYVDPQSHWGLSIAIFSLNIFVYYLLGWLISTSFYRFSTVNGIVSIFISLVVLMLVDTLLRLSLDLPILNTLSGLNVLPLGVTLLVLLLLISLTLWSVRSVTKKVRIKM